jgi:N-acetylmuramoyl-L-alanine amidase
MRRSANAPMMALLLAATTATLAAQAPTAPPAASPAAPQRFVVVLDAAHGGDDAGAHFGNEQEKAYTLALSVRLRSLLMARGFAVLTTREADTTVDADRRVEIANRANAQACLSLHAAESGEGVHLFMSSLAAAQPSRFHAWKTAQAPWVMRSVALAGDLNAALKNSGLTVTLGRTALPVVDSLACPAVAVEVAPQHAAGGDANGQGAATTSSSIDDPSYMAQVAEALAAALVEWRSDGMGGRHP